MSSNNRNRIVGLVLVFFICLICLSTPFQNFASLPNEFRFFSGQDKQVNFALPVSAQVVVQDPQVVQINGNAKQSFQIDLNHPLSLQSVAAGDTEVQVKLFGAIPLKTFRVHVVPDIKVVPGGQTIGVKMKSKGIMIVGHHQIHVKNDMIKSPGEEAEIRVGDRIMKMNGMEIKDITSVARIVNEAGKKNKPIVIELNRGNQSYSVSLTPVFDAVDKSYRLGLYIRDTAAGVGTLTFYAPEQGVYGALGHVITDMDTQMPIEVGSGQILHTTVTSISKSQNGEPGEKRATFYENSKVLGNIFKNSPYGIFGQMNDDPGHGLYKEPIPVAFPEDVKEGPAKILTVLNGQEVEEFDVEIVHVASQSSPATKGLVIKVTDKKLIEETGGIVQGMSGSPIIQNGKLVGAVTHVFVNDPTSGYGCFIEWMLQDAGIQLRKNQQRAG